MKKGYFYKQYPALIPANWDYIYFNAAIGTQYDSSFMQRWADADPFKRGIVFIPVLTPDDDVNDNASLHLQLLQECNPAWRDTEAPIIIDYTSAPIGGRLGFDQIRAYVGYIRDHWDMQGKKVLLRASLSVWESWFNHQPLTKGMLDVIEPLVVQWGANRPGIIPDFGYPKWWEYEDGMNIWTPGLIAYDPTATWFTLPSPVEDVIIDVEPDEAPDEIVVIPDEDTPPVEEFQVAKKYKISLLGGLIQGTIEEVL